MMDDLRDSHLETRKAILKALLGDCDPVRYTDHVIGTGIAFFRLVKDAGLEGVVAKRRAATYSGLGEKVRVFHLSSLPGQTAPSLLRLRGHLGWGPLNYSGLHSVQPQAATEPSGPLFIPTYPKVAI